jgi:hypothetical protein
MTWHQHPLSIMYDILSLTSVRWVPCHHSMGCAQIVNWGKGLQLWRAAANTFLFIINQQRLLAHNKLHLLAKFYFTEAQYSVMSFSPSITHHYRNVPFHYALTGYWCYSIQGNRTLLTPNFLGANCNRILAQLTYLYTLQATHRFHLPHVGR